jgi:hypothetical protein
MTALKLRPAHLSDFDHMKSVRLPNWGRWARQYGGPMPASAGNIYDMGGKDNRAGMDVQGDEGEFDSGHEEVAPKVDYADAEGLDCYILQLHITHKKIIKRAYYRPESVHRIDLDTAIRYLLDLIYDNSRVNNRMRGVYG